MLRRCPKFGFDIQISMYSNLITGKPKPSKDYLLENNISRFEYRFGSIILVDTHQYHHFAIIPGVCNLHIVA